MACLGRMRAGSMTRQMLVSVHVGPSRAAEGPFKQPLPPALKGGNQGAGTQGRNLLEALFTKTERGERAPVPLPRRAASGRAVGRSDWL